MATGSICGKEQWRLRLSALLGDRLVWLGEWVRRISKPTIRPCVPSCAVVPLLWLWLRLLRSDKPVLTVFVSGEGKPGGLRVVLRKTGSGNYVATS